MCCRPFNLDVAAVPPRHGCCTPRPAATNGKSGPVIKPADEILFNPDIGNVNTRRCLHVGRQLDHSTRLQRPTIRSQRDPRPATTLGSLAGASRGSTARARQLNSRRPPPTTPSWCGVCRLLLLVAELDTRQLPPSGRIASLWPVLRCLPDGPAGSLGALAPPARRRLRGQELERLRSAVESRPRSNSAAA